ncbi:MAG: DUF3098 domain-containing protein [Alistipes sp.]|jgi:hypothetical protein|nr:DUF3098 domain-containing protein [Alistipes sp.]
MKWFKNLNDNNDSKMALTMKNYALIALGAVIIIVGFVLMAGGTAATAEQFNEDIFSFRRITLAPIVVVAGFAFEVYAILKRF